MWEVCVTVLPRIICTVFVLSKEGRCLHDMSNCLIVKRGLMYLSFNMKAMFIINFAEIMESSGHLQRGGCNRKPLLQDDVIQASPMLLLIWSQKWDSYQLCCLPLGRARCAQYKTSFSCHKSTMTTWGCKDSVSTPVVIKHWTFQSSVNTDANDAGFKLQMSNGKYEVTNKLDSYEMESEGKVHTIVFQAFMFIQLLHCFRCWLSLFYAQKRWKTQEAADDEQLNYLLNTFYDKLREKAKSSATLEIKWQSQNIFHKPLRLLICFFKWNVDINDVQPTSVVLVLECYTLYYKPCSFPTSPTAAVRERRLWLSAAALRSWSFWNMKVLHCSSVKTLQDSHCHSEL